MSVTKGMVFRGRLSVPKLDAAKYTQALQDAIDVQMRQAAREWLRAVIPRIPVWTGTSRGTLQPLGRLLRVAIPIAPISHSSFAQRQIAKGFGPAKGSSLGTFTFEHRAQRTLFRARIDLNYLVTNNYYNMNPPLHLITPGPYGAFEAGNTAFQQYLSNNVAQKIPKIKDYISFKSKVFGG